MFCLCSINFSAIPLSNILPFILLNCSHSFVYYFSFFPSHILPSSCSVLSFFFLIFCLPYNILLSFLHNIPCSWPSFCFTHLHNMLSFRLTTIILLSTNGLIPPTFCPIFCRVAHPVLPVQYSASFLSYVLLLRPDIFRRPAVQYSVVLLPSSTPSNFS